MSRVTRSIALSIVGSVGLGVTLYSLSPIIGMTSAVLSWPLASRIGGAVGYGSKFLFVTNKHLQSKYGRQIYSTVSLLKSTESITHGMGIVYRNYMIGSLTENGLNRTVARFYDRTEIPVILAHVSKCYNIVLYKKSSNLHTNYDDMLTIRRVSTLDASKPNVCISYDRTLGQHMVLPLGPNIEPYCPVFDQTGHLVGITICITPQRILSVKEIDSICDDADKRQIQSITHNNCRPT